MESIVLPDEPVNEHIGGFHAASTHGWLCVSRLAVSRYVSSLCLCVTKVLKRVQIKR